MKCFFYIGRGDVIVGEGGGVLFRFFFILGGVMCVWGRGGVLSLLV